MCSRTRLAGNPIVPAIPRALCQARAISVYKPARAVAAFSHARPGKPQIGRGVRDSITWASALGIRRIRRFPLRSKKYHYATAQPALVGTIAQCQHNRGQQGRGHFE